MQAVLFAAPLSVRNIQVDGKLRASVRSPFSAVQAGLMASRYFNKVHVRVPPYGRQIISGLRIGRFCATVMLSERIEPILTAVLLTCYRSSSYFASKLQFVAG